MRTVSYRLDDLRRAVIHIGRVAENEYTRVQIDAGDVFADYPDATATLKVQPPEGEAYPATVTRDGNLVVWDVTDSDLTADGSGEIQLTFESGTTVVKSPIGRISVCRSIVAEGEEPDPIQDWIDEANDVLEAVEDAIPTGGTTGQVLAKASDDDYDLEWTDQTGGGASDYSELTNKPQINSVTLSGNKSLNDLGIASASDVSAKYSKPSGGIPSSDMASAVQTSLGKADTAYQVPSGGIPSSDMASAVQTSLGKADSAYQLPSGGIPAADIASGVIPDPTSIIDDTAGDGDTGKVWSADKSSDLQSAINGKYTKPADGIPASDLASGVIPTVPVTDVQVNGTSVLSQGVANVPVASGSTFGAVKTDYTQGISIDANGKLQISYASTDDSKAGGASRRPITPANQHTATFYGLAKASGDTSQSSSSNAVGTYTEDALSKISDMLNAPVSVSGSTPSITAKSGVRYICGECSTLTITVPSSGCIDVLFESGSTATVLTVTPTKTGVTAIKWANGFDPTSLDANTTYELNILDGEYGVCCAWT